MRPSSISHERTPARPENVAEFMQLAPAREREIIAEKLLGVRPSRQRRLSFLEHANPERDEQEDER